MYACVLALAVPASGTAFAKKRAKSHAKTVKAHKPKQLSLHDRLVLVKRRYRAGELSDRAMWTQLTWLNDRGNKLAVADRVSLLDTQSLMLVEAGYPILASIYASQAVKIAPDPLAKGVSPAWRVLRKVSEKRPISSVLEIVADGVDLKGHPAPVFGTDWNYFAGNAAAEHGKNPKALSFYGDLKVDDRYFFPAKYQQAMIYVDENRLDDAETALKAILYPTSQNLSPLAGPVRKKMADYAYMALGRIYYERGKFADAARMYRQVSRDGGNFYDALFEQSWAFFMGGYPMHALGALYSVESPFYKDVFNPEAPLLRSMIHYWLCRYDDSRNALADFMERYDPEVEKLNDYLDRKHLDDETAYQLFENMISGVSAASLDLPPSVLKTAAEKDSMLFVRDQYAALVAEKEQLEAKGIFGDRSHMQKPLDYVDRWTAALRKDVGHRFLTELEDMKKDYDQLYAQAQFLYVELLMSEKDQLLGKELHASTKITHVNGKMKVGGWGDQTQAWKDSSKGEYWWDEIGWYITPVQSMCNVPQTAKN